MRRNKSCEDSSRVIQSCGWISLALSAGQSSATIAGILATRGNWIATLDADLQNDPADLAHLWNALPGHDAALGWRTTREDVVSKRILSILANRVRNAVLGQSIRDTGCSVRIFSRASALRLPLFHGMHRFIGPLLLREGCKLIQVPVKHRPRANGRSHYTLWNRSLCVLIDLFGVVWLMRRPVRYEVIAKQRSGMSADISCSENTVSPDLKWFSGELTRVEPGIVGDGGISGPGTLYRAVCPAVVGLGAEARVGRPDCILVA